MKVFSGAFEDYSVSAGGEFDAIHSAQVLEHVYDPERTIEAMASLLRPGGLVFIEVPNDFNGLQLAAQKVLHKEAWWVRPEHHLNYFDYFDYDSLAKLLASFGLQ